MPQVVYVIAQEDYAGDLSALSREAHVWVLLTDHNAELYRTACVTDDRDYSSSFGLSGFHVTGGALESLYSYLATIDAHHDDPRWDELRIIGFRASQLDVVRVRRELDVGDVRLDDEGGEVVIRRAS